MHFTKLFNSILDSTIWQEAKETKIVWVTMLAMCDRNGEIHASIPGLAARSGVTIQECEAALFCLLSPDHYSRTKAHNGRRIEEIDGGWVLLNHGKYRALLSAEERREYNRIKQKQHRAKLSNNVNDMSVNVNNVNVGEHITDADADADAEGKQTQDANASTVVVTTPVKQKRERIAFQKPTPTEVIDYAKELGACIDGKEFCDFYDSNGWRVGRNPMKDWKATVRQWEARRKTNGNGHINGHHDSPEWLLVVDTFHRFPGDTLQDREGRGAAWNKEIREALKAAGGIGRLSGNSFERKELQKDFERNFKAVAR